MPVTTLSPHLDAIIRNMLVDKTPMAAIARELNISVHRVRKVRDTKRGSMTRAQAIAEVMRAIHQWDDERLSALEKEYKFLDVPTEYKRTKERAKRLPSYKMRPTPVHTKKHNFAVKGLTKLARGK